jgi:periplasmic divalent cation tolerance protein
MNDFILAITNLPDVESAIKLAQQIVASRAAACVNLLSPCTSVYRWQGKIETTSEVPLLIKTHASVYPLLESIILASHPYELPEIIAVPLTAGLPAYFDWITRETLPCKE